MDSQTTQLQAPAQSSNAAKFAFFYMLSLVSLIFMALSTGMVIFQIINKKIVDISTSFPGAYDSGALKFAISAIIIATPIYYGMMYLINKSLNSGTLNKDSGIRKWLSYLILFISSVVVIGWLISVIYNFLDGELTTKFLLKALTAVAISASIFAYYLYDIRREKIEVKDKVICTFFYASLVIVIGSLISAFFFVESPTETRNRKQDNAILENFNMIDNAVNSYYMENKKLPAKLDDLLVSKGNYFITENNIIDPATKQKFDFKVTGKDSYELCATFKASNKNVNDISIYAYKETWPHDAGYQCLSHTLRIDIKAITDQVPSVPTPVKGR